MENKINHYLELYYTNPTWLSTQTHDMIEYHQIAIYQIERAITQLKEASTYTNKDPEWEVKFRSMAALSVIKQLEAFLETIQGKKKQKPTNIST